MPKLLGQLQSLLNRGGRIIEQIKPGMFERIRTVRRILQQQRYLLQAQRAAKGRPGTETSPAPYFRADFIASALERLWKFICKKVINLKFYPKFQQFRAAIFQFFEDIGQYKEELYSLMHSAFVHIDVKPDGKVWIQHDGTDLKIALLLADEGIQKSDIVLGFRAPSRRKMTPEFAEG